MPSLACIFFVVTCLSNDKCPMEATSIWSANFKDCSRIPNALINHIIICSLWRHDRLAKESCSVSHLFRKFSSLHTAISRSECNKRYHMYLLSFQFQEHIRSLWPLLTGRSWVEDITDRNLRWPFADLRKLLLAQCASYVSRTRLNLTAWPLMFITKLSFHPRLFLEEQMYACLLITSINFLRVLITTSSGILIVSKHTS